MNTISVGIELASLYFMKKQYSFLMFGLLLAGFLTGFPLDSVAQSQSSAQAPEVCENHISFESWLQGFKQEARKNGIQQGTLELVANELVFNPEVIKRDRSQSVFQQTFLQFADRMASDYRRQGAIKRITVTHKDLFAHVEKDFGVPPALIAAFWALESDFGASTGKFHILSAAATLAYDCRRSDKFRSQLLDALRLVQRGDIQPEEMIGNWAGELGGTQFMASDYFESGIDYDHDGRVNLVKSIPDTIATSANYLLKKGWKPGEPWMQEVKVPAQMAWEEADITIQHAQNKWKEMGVKPLSGKWDSENLPSSLILPMGRLGPAFLVYPNFRVILAWNESVTYSTTAAYLALRITGAPAMQRGSENIKSLTTEQGKELQTYLVNHNFKIGPIDGKLGSATKAAVKQVQLQFKLPADSYPTVELLEAIRRQ